MPAYQHRIPESELRYTFTRSGGAGGQNVNKVATRVTIHWDVVASAVFDDATKERLLRFAPIGQRLNSQGEVVIHEDRDRSQAENRRLARRKLEDLVHRALAPRKRRVATRPTRASKERRIETKSKRSTQKRQRRWRPGREEGS